MSNENHEVVITVNNRPVAVQGPRTTGRKIKESAIQQGVQIGVDFVLSEELENNRTRIVGDDDEITVNKHSKFVAVAPDDNS